MIIKTADDLEIELDEYDVRRWFMAVDLSQAVDTMNVVRGIVETRQSMQPKRKRRSDAGTTRVVGEQTLDLREPSK